MFKKPFNKKDGERRICLDCSLEFHTMKPINRCNPCSNKRNKNRLEEKIELGLVEKHEYKENYPFDTTNGEAVKRFHQIQYALRQCKTGEQRRAHYQKQLDEIKENGILKWIMDRRDAETKAEKKLKSKGKIDKDMPDTRYMDWDEFETGGWGNIEDS
jgi:hypothetical protein